MHRREFLAAMAAAPLVAAPVFGQSQSPQGAPPRARTKLKQSVMASVWGTGSTMSFEERCRILARIGFKAVDLPLAEQVPIMKQYGLAPAMMITNSKVVADQRTDQVFNHLAWGFDVCRTINSPRVKIVYDIYHVQIMDGDIVRNLRDNFDAICRIHVAGVPSRQEIENTQELNYGFIANAIADLGYTGFVAHEHRPGPGCDPIRSLEQCFEIMNV